MEETPGNGLPCTDMGHRVSVRAASIAVPLHQTSVEPEPLCYASRTSNLTRCITDFERTDAEFRRRYEAGDLEAPRRLVEMNPEFGKLPWVQAALSDLHDRWKSMRREQGRPYGEVGTAYAENLSLVLKVDRLAATKQISVNAAIGELAAGGFLGLSARALRQRYDASIRDPRIAPMLFEHRLVT